MRRWQSLVLLLGMASVVQAEPPGLEFVFPAGGQRGAAVEARIGGYYVHDKIAFAVEGSGVTGPAEMTRIPTIWFEGPVIPQPASQQKEDYPVDSAARLSIAQDTPRGVRRLLVHNLQGTSNSLLFMVGDLPEVSEQETDGQPIPQLVSLPVTANGRIFPREDIDHWAFEARAGEVITCEVNAARLGSPFDAHLVIRDPSGTVVAQNSDTFGTDPFVRFTAREAGRYVAQIHDAAFSGLQNHVYRLTISAQAWVDQVFPVGGRAGEEITLQLTGANLTQTTATVRLPQTPGTVYRWYPSGTHCGEFGIPLMVGAAQATEVVDQTVIGSPLPTADDLVINGHLSASQNRQVYTFSASQGETSDWSVTAAAVGSRLFPDVRILAADGKPLAVSKFAPEIDPRLKFTAPAAGEFRVEISSLSSLPAEPQPYRLRRTLQGPGETVPFALTAAVSVLNLDRGGTTKLRVNVVRGSYDGDIALQFPGLPEGMTATDTTIKAKQARADITLTATPTAAFGRSLITLQGTAMVQEQPVTVLGTLQEQAAGEPSRNQISLAVNVPTPFKFAGSFESKFIPRGSVYVRHYSVERNGYEGAITVQLADRQTRHLQGITGPTVVVPAGQTEFDYPAKLPPWLDVGRTSRTCLMAIGEVDVGDGRTARVTYTSQAQNDQMIVLTAPEEFSLDAAISSVRAITSTTVDIPVTIGRSRQLTQAVTVEVEVPQHISGVTAEPVLLAAGENSAVLRLSFGEQALGPFNMPLTLRASTTDPHGNLVTAECPLEIVPSK